MNKLRNRQEKRQALQFAMDYLSTLPNILIISSLFLWILFREKSRSLQYDKQLETKIYWICGFCLSRCCSASLLLKKCNRIRILFLSRSPFSLMTGKRSPLNWPTSDLFPLASSFPGNLTVTTSSLTVQSLHWPSPSMGHVDNVA